MRSASACPVCSDDALGVLLEASELEAERRWLRRFRARSSLSAYGAEQEPASELEAVRLLGCRRCGTVLRDPTPGGAAHASTRADLGRSRGLLEPPCSTRVERLLAGAPRIVRHLPASPLVLGVGHSPSEFVRAAHLAGWRAVGIEGGRGEAAFVRAAGPEAREEDAAGLGAREDREDPAASLGLPTSSWDAVFSWDASLVGDPGPLLERAAAWLRPGGVLVLRIPNGKFELACLYLRRRWRGSRRATRVLCAQAYNGFLAFPHARGYTPTSIRRLLAAHGFATDAIVGDTALDPPCVDPTGFATREEARYRRAIQRYCRIVETATGCLYHPWLAVIARQGPRAATSCCDAGAKRAAADRSHNVAIL